LELQMVEVCLDKRTWHRGKYISYQRWYYH
jgi:hypothetical protein